MGNNVRHIDRKKIEEGTSPDKKKLREVEILENWSGQNLAVGEI